MKRTWIVCVAHGPGHELNNTTDETEFYGPFTEERAEELKDELNEILGSGDEEELEAFTLPLENIPPVKIVAKYIDYVRNRSDDTE